MVFRDVVDELGETIPGAVGSLERSKGLGIHEGSEAQVAKKRVKIAAVVGLVLPKLGRLHNPQTQLLLLRFCAHPICCAGGAWAQQHHPGVPAGGGGEPMSLWGGDCVP